MHGGVRSHAEDREEGFANAIAAEEDDSGPQRRQRRLGVEPLAVARRSPSRALNAGERTKELHLTIPFRAGKSQDLALPHFEIDRPEPVSAQPRDREQNVLRPARAVSVRERVLERAPDHERHE